MQLKLYIAAGFVACTLLVSCAGEDSKSYTDKSVEPTAAEKAAAEKAAAEKAALNTGLPTQSTVPAPVLPGQNTTMPVTLPQQGQQMPINPQTLNQAAAPVITQTTTPTVTQPGMNPPHGQPGHRCDISVGAPLNSKPAAPATVSAAPQQQQVTMTPVPSTTKTAPGMNPPHGEAGHRCDIAVGAPLNSKPAAPTTVSTSTTPAPLVTTPKTDSSKN